jgi:hypothetical protein
MNMAVWGARYTLGVPYLYIKKNVKKVWGARYLPENTVFPNSYIILFWGFYFLPFSVHAQTNIIYVALLSLL